MAAAIQIRPKSDQLARGKAMRVPITIILDEPLRVRGVHAVFHGAEETKANYTTYNAATKTMQTHTAVQYVDIVRRDFLLWGNERLGCLGNLADGVATLFGGGEHETLPAGEHSFEVEIEAPDDAPDAFQGGKCRIFYELSVRIDTPLARDVTAVYAFTLPMLPKPAVKSELVRTRYPEDQGRGLLDSWFGPDLRVEAALSESVFRPDDVIEGVFRVDAPQPLECRSISARLLGVERTEAQGHRDTHTHAGSPTLVAAPGTIERSHKQDFQLPAYLAGPPTAQGRLFAIDWFVQIELDVPWAKDPKIRVPIMLLAE